MSYVFPRHSRITVPLANSASGCYITDKDGKKYFDGSGGAAVSCLGHGDSDVNEAIQKQLSQIAFAHNSFFTSEVLGGTLIRRSSKIRNLSSFTNLEIIDLRAPLYIFLFTFFFLGVL